MSDTKPTADRLPYQEYRSSIPRTTLKIPMPPGAKPPRPAPEAEVPKDEPAKN